MSSANLLDLIFFVLTNGLNIYSYIIIAYCLFSFIPQAFSSPIGYKIYITVYRLSRPAFDLVQMIIPARFLTFGMISITPILVFLGIHLMQYGLFSLYSILKGML